MKKIYNKKISKPSFRDFEHLHEDHNNHVLLIWKLIHQSPYIYHVLSYMFKLIIYATGVFIFNHLFLIIICFIKLILYCMVNFADGH